MSTPAPLPSATPPWLFPLRMATAFRHQAERSLRCPPTPRVDGQLAVVTGGNGGIGLATCRGLLQRGAHVVMAARNTDKAARAEGQLREELGQDVPLELLPLDLSDLDSVVAFTHALGDRPVHLLVANAGIWPKRHSLSAQGHELAFATNVLGHHLLIRRLTPLLPAGARVIVLTGDIYCLVGACTPDYRFTTALGGVLAYCRSKLGNLWLVAELQARHAGWAVHAVHPGVVASDLGRPEDGGRREMGGTIDCDAGAQTTLYAATQPGLPPGAYLHNTMGLVQLRPRDAARNREAAAALWNSCEQLCEGKACSSLAPSGTGT